MRLARPTGAALVGLLVFGPGPTGCGGKPETRLETARADRGPLVAKVTATGVLSALVTVQVGSQVSGRLSEILVDFNSEVKKGQTIARLDAQLFEAALEQARANHAASLADLKRAQVQAKDAGRQLDRAQSLLSRKLIAQADFDTAQATAEAAAAQVDSAAGRVQQTSAALRQAQINLAYTTIASPINGTVISRNVDVGQTVAASLQAPTLFVIAEDLRRMQVDTSVAEADIGRLQPGMRATFTVDAYANERFAGEVRQIRNAATTVQNVVTYDAVIDVANPDLRLKPGMTANVTFIYAEKADVVRVPNAALRFKPPPEFRAAARAPFEADGPRPEADADDSGLPAKGVRAQQRVVWIQRAEGPAPVRVATGLTDGSLTEITSGDLNPGDVVILDAFSGGLKFGLMGGPPTRRP